MTALNRRLKYIQFTLAGVAFECQLESWTMTNNSVDGDKKFTYCPDGEFREESDPDWALDLRFFSDWRSGGISDYLTLNDNVTVAFVLDHHADIVGEHVRWTGTLKVRAPSIGGDVRTTEQTSVTLPVIGAPTYARI